MDIRYFHLYKKLVLRGEAPPLLCTCGTEYVTMLGEGDEPVLRCFTCDSLTLPGLAMYAKVVDAVSRKLANDD